jgi:hypothetical protein
MIELEQRLRSALADLADEVPPSVDAFAEQRRRQAGERPPARRRPMLAVAAAAVVFGIGVIPAAVTRDTQPGGGIRSGQPAPPSLPGTESRHTDPSPDGPYLTITNGPFSVAEFTENGRQWSVLVFLERRPAGTGWVHRACAVGVPPGATPNDPDRYPGSTGCLSPSEQSWPKVRSSPLVVNRNPDGGPFPGLMLVIAPPQVSRLDVRGSLGKPAPVTELARTADLVMYLTDLGGIGVPFYYTARDAAGAVIEERTG